MAFAARVVLGASLPVDTSLAVVVVRDFDSLQLSWGIEGLQHAYSGKRFRV